mmetsp:Transcript_54579/g.97012  ORF Transcript_54579/g.97012 Transcript_54579/m.97012 type:complete len:86 (-) Transcript_54579:806-1063(-)
MNLSYVRQIDHSSQFDHSSMQSIPLPPDIFFQTQTCPTSFGPRPVQTQTQTQTQTTLYSCTAQGSIFTEEWGGHRLTLPMYFGTT